MHYMTGYDNMMTDYHLRFKDIGICPYKSAIRFTTPPNFVRIVSNVMHTSPLPVAEPYAVVMSTGVCEVEREVQMEKIKKHIHALVQFVFESCMGPIDESKPQSQRKGNKNLFFYKFEEATSPYKLLELLPELNDYVNTNVVTHSRPHHSA